MIIRRPTSQIPTTDSKISSLILKVNLGTTTVYPINISWYLSMSILKKPIYHNAPWGIMIDRLSLYLTTHGLNRVIINFLPLDNPSDLVCQI